MERERLTRLLEDPGRATREDAAALRAMAEQYPWFTGAQLLRAASERAQGNVLADEALRIAAAHLPSRAVLHDLVQRAGSPPATLRVVKPVLAPPSPTEEPVALASVAEHVAIPVPPIGPPVSDTQVEAEPASQVKETAERAAAPESPRPELQAAPPPVVNVQADAAPSKNGAEEPQPGPMEVDEVPPALSQAPAEAPLAEQTADKDALDRQITEAALASAFDLTYLENLRTPPAPTAPLAEPPEPAPAEPSATPASRLRFTDWLASASGAPVSGNPSERGIPSAAQAPDQAKPLPAAATAAAAPSPLSTAAPKPVANEGALSASTLIDRFIRQQPPEIPPKPAFFTPQQAARKSLDDTAGLVTETLARIYEQQGNLPKAIEAYRRLALKYPEKSAYFAALSKALEEQQTP